MLSQLEEPRHPQINIGRDFQADLPALCNDRIDLHRVPEQLLWDPGINDALDDNEGMVISFRNNCSREKPDISVHLDVSWVKAIG